jgi:hypothetical protein
MSHTASQLDNRESAGTGGGCWLDQANFALCPTNVCDALVALEAVTEHFLRLGDQRAAFPGIYALITRRVAERAEWGPKRYFREPAWISRLAGRFCERYLETLRWSLGGQPQDCGSWEVAYALLDRPDAPPIQHAFLGLAAHINFDLAIGISRTLADFGCASDRARLRRCKHDHDIVNELLRESVPEALHRLASRHDCGVSGILLERGRHAVERVTMAILGSWRDHVWSDAVVLLRNPSGPTRAALLHRMERRSYRIAKVFASPAPVPHLLVADAAMRFATVGS